MQTTVHAYHFDTSIQNERTAWEALRAKLATWPHRMKSLTMGESYYETGRKLDGQTVTLETKHLFNNQWNTAPIEGVSTVGLRVFDWAQDAIFRPYNGSENKTIKRGYYLDQTDEMREIRRNTDACGYCGKQEPAAKGYVFCPHCLDSEYLKESDLLLTRMRAVEADRFKEQLPPLTDAEAAHLIPLFREAQLHGSTVRGKARIAKQRQQIESEYQTTKANAEEKHTAALWIADRMPGMLSNWIYYSHTNKHSFGWRKPLSAGEVSALLDIISEFPFGYEIKCEDGRTLEATT